MPLRSSTAFITLALAMSACATSVYDDELAPDDPAPIPFSDQPRQPQRSSLRPQTVLDEGAVREDLRAVAAWDFEPASADCNGWSATGASAIRAVPSHSGAYACKLCADGSAAEMKLTRRVGLSRGHWVVSAWLRRHGRSIASVAARVTLDEATERAGIPIQLVDEWRLLGDPLEVPSDLASATLSIVATAEPGDCLLVDDVIVESATAKAAHSSRPATPYEFMRR